MRRLLWGLLSAVFLILAILTVKFSFNNVFFLNSPCDCLDEAKFKTMGVPGEGIEEWYLENHEMTCLYRAVYNSGQYTDCSYLDFGCSDYLERKGIDCSEKKCGILTTKEFEETFNEGLSAAGELGAMTTEGVETIDDLAARAELRRELTDDMFALSEISNSWPRIKEYLAENGCPIEE